jgi:hypothetical protein
LKLMRADSITRTSASSFAVFSGVNDL